MKSLRLVSAAIAAVCMISVAAYAADPTGTWKFTQQGRGGEQEITFKLALKDGSLTGTVTQPGRQGGAPTDIAISDASFKDDTVAFSTVQEYNGNKRVTKYTGKLDGDTIKGTVLAPGRGGAEPMPRDWVATKAKM